VGFILSTTISHNHQRLLISWDLAHEPQRETSLVHAGDMFRNRGEDMIQEAALAAIEMRKALLASQAESSAATFLKGVDKLNAAQSKLTESFGQRCYTRL
jgi:hypothetical protein